MKFSSTENNKITGINRVIYECFNEMLNWASKSYDTIAFESWDVEDTEISNNLINIMQKYSLEEYVQLKGFC